MEYKLVNIGFGNVVLFNRVIAVVAPGSAPIKRLVQDARDRGQLVDATYRRRCRAVIVTDSGHVVLSALLPETIARRAREDLLEDAPASDLERSEEDEA